MSADTFFDDFFGDDTLPEDDYRSALEMDVDLEAQDKLDAEADERQAFAEAFDLDWG